MTPERSPGGLSAASVGRYLRTVCTTLRHAYVTRRGAKIPTTRHAPSPSGRPKPGPVLDSFDRLKGLGPNSNHDAARRFRTTRPCSGPGVVGAGTNGRQQLTSKSTVQSLSSLGQLLYRSSTRREFEVSYEVMHDVFGAFSTTYEVEARCDDNTSINRDSSTKNFWPNSLHILCESEAPRM